MTQSQQIPDGNKAFTNTYASASEAGREGYSTDQIIKRERWGNSPFEIISNPEFSIVVWGKFRLVDRKFKDILEAATWCEQHQWDIILQVSGIIAQHAINTWEEDAAKDAQKVVDEIKQNHPEIFNQNNITSDDVTAEDGAHLK